MPASPANMKDRWHHAMELAVPYAEGQMKPGEKIANQFSLQMVRNLSDKRKDKRSLMVQLLSQDTALANAEESGTQCKACANCSAMKESYEEEKAHFYRELEHLRRGITKVFEMCAQYMSAANLRAIQQSAQLSVRFFTQHGDRGAALDQDFGGLPTPSHSEGQARRGSVGDDRALQEEIADLQRHIEKLEQDLDTMEKENAHLKQLVKRASLSNSGPVRIRTAQVQTDPLNIPPPSHKGHAHIESHSHNRHSSKSPPHSRSTSKTYADVTPQRTHSKIDARKPREAHSPGSKEKPGDSNHHSPERKEKQKRERKTVAGHSSKIRDHSPDHDHDDHDHARADHFSHDHHRAGGEVDYKSLLEKAMDEQNKLKRRLADAQREAAEALEKARLAQEEARLAKGLPSEHAMKRRASIAKPQRALQPNDALRREQRPSVVKSELGAGMALDTKGKDTVELIFENEEELEDWKHEAAEATSRQEMLGRRLRSASGSDAGGHAFQVHWSVHAPGHEDEGHVDEFSDLPAGTAAGGYPVKMILSFEPDEASDDEHPLAMKRHLSLGLKSQRRFSQGLLHEDQYVDAATSPTIADTARQRLSCFSLMDDEEEPTKSRTRNKCTGNGPGPGLADIVAEALIVDNRNGLMPSEREKLMNKRATTFEKRRSALGVALGIGGSIAEGGTSSQSVAAQARRSITDSDGAMSMAQAAEARKSIYQSGSNRKGMRRASHNSEASNVPAAQARSSSRDGTSDDGSPAQDSPLPEASAGKMDSQRPQSQGSQGRGLSRDLMSKGGMSRQPQGPAETRMRQEQDGAVARPGSRKALLTEFTGSPRLDPGPGNRKLMAGSPLPSTAMYSSSSPGHSLSAPGLGSGSPGLLVAGRNGKCEWEPYILDVWDRRPYTDGSARRKKGERRPKSQGASVSSPPSPGTLYQKPRRRCFRLADLLVDMPPDLVESFPFPELPMRTSSPRERPTTAP